MARTLDEILTTEIPDVVTQAREKADLMRLEIHLTQLREMLAQACTDPMICDQDPSIGLEIRHDSVFSTWWHASW